MSVAAYFIGGPADLTKMALMQRYPHYYFAVQENVTHIGSFDKDAPILPVKMKRARYEASYYCRYMHATVYEYVGDE